MAEYYESFKNSTPQQQSLYVEFEPGCPVLLRRLNKRCKQNIERHNEDHTQQLQRLYKKKSPGCELWEVPINYDNLRNSEQHNIWETPKLEE